MPVAVRVFEWKIIPQLQNLTSNFEKSYFGIYPSEKFDILAILDFFSAPKKLNLLVIQSPIPFNPPSPSPPLCDISSIREAYIANSRLLRFLRLVKIESRFFRK